MKYIENYENLYSVTKNGRVYSHIRNKFLKLQEDKNGYHCIGLWKNKKYKRLQVHRIVAKTFIKNNQNRPCINHINGIKTDNRVENLEWCTFSENNIHAYKTGLLCRKGENHNLSKLTNEQAMYIYKNKTYNNKALADRFGVDRSIISKIRNKKIWKHIHK